jgi:5-formyltetrahydrofolate cyclo-ligase
MDADIKQIKAALRREIELRRSAMSPVARTEASAAVARVPVAVVDGEPTTVSLFLPIGTEIDTRPLAERLRNRGHVVALPVMQARSAPLLFRAWAPGSPLVERKWGIREPADDAPVVTPRVLFVPLLAFDRQGFRLGYGGGFYDRTLARLRAEPELPTAIGLGFDCQRVDAVPHLDYDQRLDLVLTESGLQTFGE